MKKNIKKLFENLCCATCRTGFDEDSIFISRYQQDLIVAQLKCKNCGRGYGVAFVGFSGGIPLKGDEEPLEVQQGPDAINYDDVIDAHKFIQNLDEHWQNKKKKK